MTLPGRPRDRHREKMERAHSHPVQAPEPLAPAGWHRGPWRSDRAMLTDVVRDEGALLRLEPEWESLVGNAVHPSIFMTFDYQYAGWQAFHRDHSEPYVIVVRDAASTV